jgi:hypothetical protein
MAKRGSRSKKNFSLFRRVYSPLNHLVGLSRNVSRNAFSKVGKGVNLGLGFVQNTGRGVARGADGAVTSVVRGPSFRRGRNGRRNNMSARRSSRRNRRNMTARR